MYIFQCKLCGGKIQFEQGATIGECESCGIKQTLPRLDSDKKANLYDRANHFRRNNDFDKAMALYEQILNEDNADAEAYWSLVLCRYGIEYVEDPATHERIPTVNRAQLTSIFAEEDYKSALRYADADQREIYEAEARAIDEIQKGILEISGREEPFDVFICYKETDANGRRTQDSVFANDLYHQLTQEGFKVFFSRITLEDKIGTAYEPYIFAALNSAKVMVVLGTRPEYFNAVWVRNEWSRYLALIKKGAKKTLIPAYRDMDPYDLPEEFSHLQGQDMSKLGFMQDLLRGIRKIIDDDVVKPARETIVINSGAVNNGNANPAPLLERAFLFLEDGNWLDADEYCERVLDQEPRNARAYLGKLMAQLHVHSQGDLQDCDEPFDDSDNYQKAIRFADKNLSRTLKGYISAINQRNERERLNSIYDSAVKTMKSAQSSEKYKNAAKQFQSISGFKDAAALAKKCLDKAEICRKNEVYISAKIKMDEEKVESYQEAIRIFKTIPGWRDAKDQIIVCERKIQKCKAREEAEQLAAEEAAKKRKKLIIIGISTVAAFFGLSILLAAILIPKLERNEAMKLLEAGEYRKAYAIFERLGDYDAITENKYDRAAEYITAEDYEKAYSLLAELGDNEAIVKNKYDRAAGYIAAGNYEDAYRLYAELGENDTIIKSKYDRAVEYIDTRDYKRAYELLRSLDYEDSAEKQRDIMERMLKEANVGDEIVFGAYEQKVSINGPEIIEWYVLAKEENKILVISKYGLDSMPYAEKENKTRWENCSLRKWLNGNFLDSFNDDEQAKIAVTKISAERNPKHYSIYPGSDTQDKVFLLSISEAEEYFSSDSERVCDSTQYIEKDDVFYDISGRCYWWLRSFGGEYGTCVDAKGSILEDVFRATREDFAVRPAMWIEVEP